MIDGTKAAALLEQLVARTLTTLQSLDGDHTPMHEGMALAYRDTLATLVDQAEAIGVSRAVLGLGQFDPRK